MQRLVSFVTRAAILNGGEFAKQGNVKWQLTLPQEKIPVFFTTDRNLAIEEEALNLVGLEHPIIRDFMIKFLSLDNSKRAVSGRIKDSGS